MIACPHCNVTGQQNIYLDAVPNTAIDRLFADLRTSGRSGYIYLEGDDKRLRIILTDDFGRWTNLVLYCYMCRQIYLCTRANWIEVCAEGMAEIVKERVVKYGPIVGAAPP